MDIRTVIDAAREAVGGTQSDLAGRLGVAPSAVSAWYSGKSVPDFESCLRLARWSGIPATAVLATAEHDAELLEAVAGAGTPAHSDPVRAAQHRELDGWLDSAGEGESLLWGLLRSTARAGVRMVGAPHVTQHGQTRNGGKGNSFIRPNGDIIGQDCDAGLLRRGRLVSRSGAAGAAA